MHLSKLRTVHPKDLILLYKNFKQKIKKCASVIFHDYFCCYLFVYFEAMLFILIMVCG